MPVTETSASRTCSRATCVAGSNSPERSLELNPRSSSDRYNLAIYSVYAGDFDTAVKEGTRLAKESPTFPPGGLLPVALATLLRGDREGALAAYGQLEQVSPDGKSLGRYGRADLQMQVGQVQRGAQDAAGSHRGRREGG